MLKVVWDQHSCVAKQTNKSLLERTRVMLKITGMAKSFWEEVVKTTCYVINRSPSTTIDLKTLMEMWIRNPVDYSSLLVFGCPMYVMYKFQERLKVDPKSRNCILLAYADHVKDYLLWDPTVRKVILAWM
jgi:hypothetical protein